MNLLHNARSVRVWKYTVNGLNFVNKSFYKMAYANCADPDQTAPEEVVWSGSTLFAILLSI